MKTLRCFISKHSLPIFSPHATRTALYAAFLFLGVLLSTESAWGWKSDVSISGYATANSWANENKYDEVTIDSYVKASHGDKNGNNAKYYTSGSCWRFYQSYGGTIVISTTLGTLTSVTFTYSVSNTGVLLYGETQVSSGTTQNVSGTSATFTVGNTGSATNGQVSITAISVTYSECDSYTFHSKNSSSVWDTEFCFSQVGSSTLYRTDEIYLPSDGVSFKVGWKGGDHTDNAKTTETDWQYMSAGPSTTRGNDDGYWSIGGHVTSGWAAGAKGYFYIYSNSNDNNKYVGFTPSGYVFRFGHDTPTSSWTSHIFTPKTSDVDETEWNTDLVTLGSSNASDNIYVGLETEDSYEWCNNSETQRVIFFSPGVWAADDCKFGLWDKTHLGWRGFMQDDDGDGIYEGTVPYNCAEVTFARFDKAKTEPEWDQQYDKSPDQTISSLTDKNMYSVSGWGSSNVCTGDWETVYEKSGTFRINAGKNLKNWSCKFVPHYVLSYNSNTGSGSMDDQSVAYDAASKSLTIAANGFTAPTGKYFTGWNTKADGSGADMSAGGSITLDQDTILYAQWAAKPLTSISLSPASGTVYVGQYKEFAITYDPEDVLTKGTTLVTTPGYCVTTGTTSTTLKLTGGRGGVTITTNQTETVTVKAKADETKTASVEITVKPLPKVHFQDLVHGESFSDVSATIEANDFVKDQNTPTHDDWTTPNANTCESGHLVLKGWIDSEWSGVTTYLEGGSAPSKSDITSSTGYYYAKNTSIDVDANDGKTYYAVWGNAGDDEYVFSCSEIELEVKTVPAGTPIFITSSASQTVRSQDSILIVGSGLTPSQALAFPDLPAKFSIKSRSNGSLSVKADGTIDTVAYIFYTPGAGDTSDGLDKLTGISVKVGGTKPRQVNLTQDIIGRHLPADFVIAAKYNNVWYALPDTMTGKRTPDPIEIAVDDNDNPSIAYTSDETLYQLYGQSSGAGYLEEAGWYVKLAMKNNKSENAPLSGDKSESGVGKGTATVITNAIREDYWWKFTQTSTSITNPQDAKYIAYCANNTTNHLRIKNKPNQWGLYSSGVEEIRLIPASTTPFTDAEVVAWGQKKLIVEVDKPTIGATQVRAKLNGSYSAKKSLATTTGTSVKGTSTRYNYTLDFTGEFDFSAESNKEKILLFEWLDGSDNVLYVSSVSVPLIIASSTNMSAVKTGAGGSGTKAYWKDLEVHILPGVTLTANFGTMPNGTTINELHIYPGATLNIASGSNARTLDINTLVLRNGWNRLTGEKSYDVARLYIQPYIDESHKASSLVATEAYMDWYIDYDQYYPVAVPWTVTVEDMSYVNTSGSAADGVIFRKYDGERRAADSKPGGGENTNWQTITPTNLVPGIGYAMTARRPAGKAFSIVRMPLTIPSNDWTTNGEQGDVTVEAVTTHKDQVVVTAWADTKTPEYAKGWNFIANPYMSLYTGTIEYTDGTEVADLNIPDVEFKEFDQVATETKKLKPSSAFLIQAPKDGTIVFGTGKRASSAPSYRREVQDEPAPVQKAYIILSGDEAEDMMGLRIGAQYTEDYEINADLEKLLSNGNTLRTYMHYGDLNMAYVAINETLAQEYIPVSVRIPADGEYTYSLHWASRIDELEGVYLYDYSTGQVTNLIEENYTFVAEAGTIHNRFAINAIKGQRDTPTDIDIGQAVGETDRSKPIKFLYRDKVYILFGSELYDATGKHVKTINR